MNIDEVFENIRNNPKLAYSIILSIFALVLIGYIKKWKWATEATGNSKSMLLVRWFGFENYRKIMIVQLSIAIIGLLFLLCTA